MFKSLRDKIGGWFKKKPEEEKTVEEKPGKQTKEEKKKEVKGKKPVKKKPEKKGKVTQQEVSHPPTQLEVKKPVEKVLQEKAAEIKEEVPVKSSVGLQKHVPDKESIKEKIEELEKVEDELEDLEGKDVAFAPLGVPIETEGKEDVSSPIPHPPTRIEGTKNTGKEERPEEKIREETLEPQVEEKSAEEQTGFFGRLRKRLTTSELKQEEFDEIFEDLEFILLENNVALSVVDKIKEELGKDLVGISVKKGEVENVIKESLTKAIDSVLIEGKDLVQEIEKSLDKVYVVLFFGINGSGKTTSVAKLASKLKENGISSLLAACDTFRAASIEQLETHAEKIGVPIVKGDYGKDPASVAFDAISYAKKNKIKVVLIDTAGRMYTKTNLMKEMEKIVKVANANKKIFVGESITGNDATEQAKMFNETAGIDGIILTKADVDEKAGTILSVSHVTGKPILYLGVGQEYGDLKEFRKDDVLKGLGLD